MSRLFVLDAMGLAYRAYYAFIRRPLVNSRGENTSALFGFANTVLKIRHEERPEYWALAWDGPGCEVFVIANGDTRTVAGFSVEAVPMYNIKNEFAPGQPYHTKGRGNGYVITVGGKRLFFAGDTECVPEIKALKDIDVAFLPMNLPFTMSPADAADCVKAFKPTIAIP